MPKINLLYIITKLELGGAQKHLLQLIAFLDKREFNVFLFTATEGLMHQDALGINGLTIEKSRFLERPVNPVNDFLALLEIRGFIKKNNIDIVHTHSSKAGILGRLAAKIGGVKIIVHTVHGWSFNGYQPKPVRLIYIWLERLAASFTDKLIVVSNYDKRKGLEVSIGSEDKYVLIRYGIDTFGFHCKGRALRDSLGINAGDPVVGTISCFKPQKSPSDFVKLAFLVSQGIPDVKFVLAGDGVLRSPVEKLIERLNLRSKIILTGWRRDIPDILGMLDVFVLTSLWEGLPISVLEAMAASLPVVVTNTGGISEVVIEGESGFLVTPKDMEKMSEKVNLLLKDAALRKTMGDSSMAALGSDYSPFNTAQNSRKLYLALYAKRHKTY